MMTPFLPLSHWNRHRPKAPWLASATLCLLLAGGAQAALLESNKLTAGDGAGFDEFGNAVALDGNTIAVGAYGDDDDGQRSGSAYLFNADTGTQVIKLTASDAGEEERFGRSVALSGNTVVVGAYQDNNVNGDQAGAAYLFNATTGTQTSKLIADDGDDYDLFGASVAIDGNVVAVGAYTEDNGNGLEAGSVYLFDADTGTQQHKLVASDGTAEDYFGIAVAVSGNTVAVGAHGEDGGGAVYLFDATSGSQIAKLEGLDTTADDRFGYSVAISGNTVVVGAYLDDDKGSASGSAYLFDATTGNQTAKLVAADGAAVDLFGYSVDISGDLVAIGAREDNEPGLATGSTYLFDASSGTFIDKLLASDANPQNYLGHSVAVDGDRVIAGATFGEGVETNTGAVYLFDVESTGSGIPSTPPLALIALGLGFRQMFRRRFSRRS